MIRKARRKPIIFPEIEFVQFTYKNKNQVFSWATGIQSNVMADFDECNNPILRIPIVGMDLICSLGDYLIKNDNDKWTKLYPIKKEEFENKYNIISEEN